MTATPARRCALVRPCRARRRVPHRLSSRHPAAELARCPRRREPEYLGDASLNLAIIARVRSRLLTAGRPAGRIWPLISFACRTEPARVVVGATPLPAKAESLVAYERQRSRVELCKRSIDRYFWQELCHAMVSRWLTTGGLVIRMNHSRPNRKVMIAEREACVIICE